MAITPRNGDLTAGVAGSWSDTINAAPDAWRTGDNPPVVTTDELVAASQDIPARTPVGFNGSGALVPAVLGTTAAIGITVYAVVTGAGDTTVRTGVYRQGTFNPELVNWPASYDTAEKKRQAFAGAPSPTAIVLRAPQTMTV